ncbi:MAG: cell division protein ZapA [Ruminococcaceae bacterium]|nr:cell division protein ZapA [Oscillospiraceae bacterium]
MEKEAHRISVRIGGMFYNLVSGESEEYTRQIAAKADEMIRRVSMASPHLSQQMTVVLALVNAVDELTRLSNQQNVSGQQQQAAEQKSAELRTELAKARELNWEMKKEILRLSALLREGKATDSAKSVVPGPEPELEVESSVENNVQSELDTETQSELDTETQSELDTEALAELATEARVEPEPMSAATEMQEINAATELKTDEANAFSEDSRSASARLSAVWGEPGEPLAEEAQPRPIDQLRQTGLDEYLSHHTSSRSTVEDIISDDEP